MKSVMEIMEEYIDCHMKREFIESLTIPEQALYKCQLIDTMSFSAFLICTRVQEFFDLIKEEFQTKFDCNHMDG